MAGLREILASFFFKVDDSGLKKADKGIDGVTSKIGELTKFLAAGVIVAKARDMVGALIDQASALDDTSQQLGVNRQELQRWQFASKLGGAEASDLSTAIRVTSKNIAAASPEFKKLGVSLKDASGTARPVLSVMQDVGLAISKLPTETARTAASLEVFGKAGTKLIPLFKDGPEGFLSAMGELDALGGGFGEDAIDALATMGDNMDRLDMASLSFKSMIVGQFLPTLTKWVTGLTKTIATFAKSKDGAAILKTTVTALGIAGAAAGVAFLAPWLPAVAFFVGLGLIIEDIVAAFQGREAYSKDFVNWLFGDTESGPTFFKEMTSVVTDFLNIVQSAPNIGEGIKNAFLDVGTDLVKFFESTLPEAIQVALDQIGGFMGNKGKSIVQPGVLQKVNEIQAAADARAAGLSPEDTDKRVRAAKEQADFAEQMLRTSHRIKQDRENAERNAANNPAATQAAQDAAFNDALATLPRLTASDFPALFSQLSEQTGASTKVLEMIAESRRVEQAVELSGARAEIGQTAGETLPVMAARASAEGQILKEVTAQQANNININNTFNIEGTADGEGVADDVASKQQEVNRAALNGIKKVRVGGS